MKPAVPVGSLILIEATGAYEIGDVITYSMTQDKNMTITHRIVDSTATGYTTKGDANNAADKKLVEQHQIKGKVITVVPYLGYVFQSLY